MRVLNTKIKLAKECTRVQFLSTLLAYLANEPKWSEIPGLKDIMKDADFTGERDQYKIHILRDKELLILTLQQTGSTACAINVIYRDNLNGSPVLGIQIDKEYISGVAPDYEKVLIPKFIRSMIWHGSFAKDNGLPTGEHAILVNMENMDMAKRILSKEQFWLPVVYVSAPREARNILNYEKLAYDLAGIAHVVVEGNPYVAKVLGEEFADKPYNGALRVYYKTLEHVVTQVNQTDSSISNLVKKKLLPYMAKNYIGEDFDILKIRTSLLMRRLSGNQELSGIFEDILSDKDQEIIQLKSALEEERQKNGKLQNRQMYGTYEAEPDGNITLNCSEKEFYPGEVRDVLLKEIDRLVQAASGDPNQEERRNYHLFQSILSENQRTGTPEQIMSGVREAIGKERNFSRIDFGTLESLGFQSDTSGTHVKLVFHGDPRYSFTAAKTSSDYRASENIIKQIERNLFGV